MKVPFFPKFINDFILIRAAVALQVPWYGVTFVTFLLKGVSVRFSVTSC
jgi:hypothetical protein